MNNDLFRSVIELATISLKAVLLVNGGAAIALLAFLGNIASTQPRSSLVSILAFALLCFTIGVLVGLIGMGISYLTQYGFLNAETEHQGVQAQPLLSHAIANRYMELAMRHRDWAMYLVISAYALFGTGCVLSFMRFMFFLPSDPPLAHTTQ